MTRTTFRGAAAALAIPLLAGVAILAAADAAQTLPDLDQQAAARLVPHQALYRMTLKSARGGSGVIGASGHMRYRVVETCDA